MIARVFVVKTMKTQTQKRIESLLWRLGMMIAAFAIDAVIKHLAEFQIPAEMVVLLGLILGEVSKAVKNQIK